MTEQIAYSADQAAKQVDVSPSTIRRAIADGELAAHHLRGTMPRILRDDLIAWIAAAPTERGAA